MDDQTRADVYIHDELVTQETSISACSIFPGSFDCATFSLVSVRNGGLGRCGLVLDARFGLLASSKLGPKLPSFVGHPSVPYTIIPPPQQQPPPTTLPRRRACSSYSPHTRPRPPAPGGAHARWRRKATYLGTYLLGGRRCGRERPSLLGQAGRTYYSNPLTIYTLLDASDGFTY